MRTLICTRTSGHQPILNDRTPRRCPLPGTCPVLGHGLTSPDGQEQKFTSVRFINRAKQSKGRARAFADLSPRCRVGHASLRSRAHKCLCTLQALVGWSGEPRCWSRCVSSQRTFSASSWTVVHTHNEESDRFGTKWLVVLAISCSCLGAARLEVRRAHPHLMQDYGQLASYRDNRTPVTSGFCQAKPPRFER